MMFGKKFVRILMEKAGTPADAGAAAGTDAQPTGTPDANATQAEPAQPAAGAQPDDGKHADNPAQPAEPANPDGTNAGKHSLLGGAKQDDNPADGSAEPKPDGGTDTGDGKQNPPADPYAELKLPDGAAVDEAQMAEYKKLAKELNLSSENAQRVLDFEAKRLAEGSAKASQAWQEQVKQEYGDKLPTVMATCARAIDKFGDNGLRDLLDQTGLGNHPLMVKLFHNVGTLLKEDTSVSASGGVKRDLTFTEALYGARSK